MRQVLALIFAAIVLTGCYENGKQRQDRLDMQRDIKDLQRRGGGYQREKADL